MRIRILCHLAFMMIICYSTALILDTRNQNYEPFCLYTKSVFGRTQCSFLCRPSATASLHFYWTIWTADQQLEECWISNEATLIQTYMTFCRGDSTWDSDGTPFIRPNISLLLKPGTPCEFKSNAVLNLVRHRRNLDVGRQVGSKNRRKRAWILPGTLWCGRGSSAGTYEQLGMFEHVDRCCREHDHCSHVIRPFTVNFGVFNPTLFTISHCNCDHRFKQCLLNVNDSVSNMVGYTFFHILKLRCFDLIQKRRCTQLNWFGMCTSVQDAPFAILKNPIPYNVSNSDPESSVISKPLINEAIPSANGKEKNNKAQRRQKQLKGQRSSDPAFLLSKKMQERFDKSKKLSPRTPHWKITTHPNLLSIHNSTFFHRKNPTITNQETYAIHKTKHIHQITKSPEPTKIMHIQTMLSQAKRFNAQKPMVTSLKKSHTNKRKTTTSQSQNTTMQIRMIHEPLSKQNCDSNVSPMDYNFQSKQQKNMICKENNALKLATESPNVLASMFPRTNKIFVNKTQPKKKAKIKPSTKTMLSSKFQVKNKSSPTVGFIPSAMPAMLPKQKIKGSNSKNESPNVTQAPKRRKPTPEKHMPTKSKNPRSTHWKDIILSPKTSLVNVSLSKEATETIYVKKRHKPLRIFSTMHHVAERMTTAHRSINPKKKSLLKQNMVSSTKTNETPCSSLRNKTNSTCEGTPSTCGPVRSLDDCMYRSRPMKKKTSQDRVNYNLPLQLHIQVD